jgi:hypothetical protein
MEIRVCTSPTSGCPCLLHPGPEWFFKLFLAKEKLVLMKKEAVLTYSAPIPDWSLFFIVD